MSATLKQQVREAAEKVNDDPTGMVCFFHPYVGGYVHDSAFGERIRCTFHELPEREFDAGFGGHEGEPFIGFTERFVYVGGVYDGAEWIEAVPRSPEVAETIRELPLIGGQ